MCTLFVFTVRKLTVKFWCSFAVITPIPAFWEQLFLFQLDFIMGLINHSLNNDLYLCLLLSLNIFWK